VGLNRFVGVGGRDSPQLYRAQGSLYIYIYIYIYSLFAMNLTRLNWLARRDERRLPAVLEHAGYIELVSSLYTNKV
jgi:hypothetical protein